jgi:prephenate dehydrogenase
LEDCDFSNFKIAVVGIGLIGGSYAMALRTLKPNYIVGIDKDINTLNKALDMDILDSAYTEPGVFLRDMDMIIISLYPKDTIDFIRENIEYFKPGVLLTDTSGIKKIVLDSVNSFLPSDIEFVGGHPMAGREYKGIEYADASIFKDANYIITPCSRNKKSSIEIISIMARKFGCKNVECISAEEHDNIIAYTSQLPHIIAAALMDESIEEMKPELFAGGSFRDATRVALINSKLWTELFMLNSDKLISKIEQFENSLSRIKKDIKDKNTNDLKAVLENSVLLKKKLN